MGTLEGRTALVTGASRGIGRAIALAFASEGADVAISYLPRYDRDRPKPDSALEVAREVEDIGRRAVVIEADVSSVDDVRAMVDTAVAELGRVDVLVNNAGFATVAWVEEMDVETWDTMIAGHLRGTFLVTRAVLPGMLERGDGRIINVASQLAHVGRERLAHYCAAKAGIIGFTKSLAREVADRGVLVNCIAPGPVDTGIVPDVPGGPDVDFIGLIPLHRLATPDEIAPTAVFLASAASTYYVGQTLGPNGGDVML
jgi:3-oxoacyl-[acyl-carrier protein] reductase